MSDLLGRIIGYDRNEPAAPSKEVSHTEVAERIVGISIGQIKKNLTDVQQQIAEKKAELEDLEEAQQIYGRALENLGEIIPAETAQRD